MAQDSKNIAVAVYFEKQEASGSGAEKKRLPKEIEQELPPDKDISTELAPPKDKWHLIYITMMFHGLGTLAAWNMFITAKNYFVEFKLKDTTYDDYYLVYVGWASQIPNLVFSWVNVFVVFAGDLSMRIVWSVSVEVLIFLVTIILAMVDSSSWAGTFFWITMVSVFILNGCNAIFQNSVFGVSSQLPFKYTGSVIIGNNVCGTVVTLLSWATAATTNLRTAAIYYFLGGMIVLIACIDTYIALPLNKFYRYYETLSQQRANQLDIAQAGIPAAMRVPYGRIFKQSWVQLYNIFITLFVTLAVYPSVHSDIKSRQEILGSHFMVVTCFLTFNVTSMLGNITASLRQLPEPNWLVVLTTVRIVFIPLFLLCNYHPHHATRTLFVFIKNDYVYWFVAILMGWSSGHCISLGMMYVGRNVDPEYASKAAMIGGAMLISGIISGIAFSGLCPTIVTMDIWKHTNVLPAAEISGYAGWSLEEVPKDRYNIIYYTLLFHGIGILTAWNMFITAKNYFVEYKLKDSPYATNFLVYIGYATKFPNVVFHWVNVFIGIRGELAQRVVVTLIIEIAIFLLTIIMAMVDSSSWTTAFFWITMITVLKLSAWNAIFQNCAYGIAAVMPSNYTGAVVMGTNLVGAIVVLLDWVTSSFTPNLRTSAIYYFIGGMFVLIVCLDTFIAMPINRFYRYHENLKKRKEILGTEQKSRPVPYRLIVKQSWVQLYNCFMSYFVSLSIFPAVHSDIYSMDNPKRVHGEGFLGDNFMRITCYLTYNATAVLGNITASFFKYPTRNWLAAFTTLRLILIPLFLMCNYHPRDMMRTMPVVVRSDWIYWALAVLLGWSLGHSGSLSMMYVGGKVDPEYASKAGMFGGAMLSTGVLFGVTLSAICPIIVTSDIWK